MNRRTTLVTAGVTALVAVTASAAVAVNTGLLSVPDDDAAGTLQLPQEITQASVDVPDTPSDVETVYVDVYDQPAQDAVPPPAAYAEAYDDDYGEYDDEYEDHDEYEDDGEYEDDDEEDEHEEYEEDEEYEGRDDDD